MREAWGFLTVLGGATPPTRRAWRWFPLVGAVLGALVGIVWWASGEVLAALPAAACAVAADLALTGMLHVDGLADSADGLLPHADRARRLEIMRDPGIGAYAVAAVVVVLITRVAAFSARPVSVALVIALWSASRTVVAVAPAWLPYAREEGLASDMLGGRAQRWPAVFLLAAGAVAWLGVGIAGAAAVASVVLVGAGVLLFARSRLGGFTGDVLGAAILLGETVGLLVAGARW
jgi:adenosylcobinamide-GDP ribazoletransferase